MNTNCITVSPMEHNAWLADLIGPDSIRRASQKVGYAATTITRQLQRGALSSEMVISLCRAYGRSPVTGLIETGYLNSWETEGVSIPYALDQATNKEFLEAIIRRSDPEARVLFGGGEDVIDIDDDAPDAEVFDFPRDTPDGASDEQQEPEESTPNVRSGRNDLDEVLRKANRLEGAAQRRTPRIEEPENP